MEVKIELKGFEDNWFLFHKIGGLDFSEIFWVWGAFDNTWKNFRKFSKINRLPRRLSYDNQTENEGRV